MSLDAHRWALNQRVGTGNAKAVLLVMADFANKKTGEIFAKAETIAEIAEVTEESVRRFWKVWTERGILIDTGQRRGGNGRVPVFTWAGFSPARKIQTNSDLTANKQRSNSDLVDASSVSFIGGRVPNREPGTDNLDEKRALGNSLSNLGNGPLAPSLSKIFSSFPSTPSAPSEKKDDEPPWRQELRELYPHITDAQILKVETKVCKGKPTRSWMLNIFNKTPREERRKETNSERRL